MTVDDLARLFPLMAEHAIVRVRVGDVEVNRGVVPVRIARPGVQADAGLTAAPVYDPTILPPPPDPDALSDEDAAEVEAYRKWQRGEASAVNG